MGGSHLLEPTDWQGLLIRVILSLVIGALVGWERESAHKPAGLRTHMLVCLSSTMFMLSGIQTGAVADSPDVLSRIIQGIATGIGFLGAGEIFQKNRSKSNEIRVRGLTSAAAIWVSASLGVAVGSGLWLIALVGAIATVFVLWGVKKIE